MTTVENADLDHPDVSLYFRQLSPISGRGQKIRGRVTCVEFNRYIGTRFLFAASLFLNSVEEIIEPADDGCLLTTNMRFTFAAKLMKHTRHKVVEHIRGELEETSANLEQK